MVVQISVLRFRNRKKRNQKRDTLVMLGMMCGVLLGQYVQSTQLHSAASEDAMATNTMTKKKVAITFDDGPNPDYTEPLLEGLKERGVTATFFLLGKEVERYPEIVKDIHDNGHLIGTHSYEHVNLKNLCDAAAIEQVDKTNAAIQEITGEYPEYIRPPYGSWKCNLDYETKMIEVL
ncbi:MAG: polysaccharide deacetylase family protein, partial [Clostridiales bacterium]|nr:polysaccharide deacetylase family protein [Clostridiales bacterium]